MIRERVKNKLGVQNETLQDTYLGMPTCLGRSPSSNFNYLTSRIWKRINGCSDRPLSRAGKEVFLKSVAQAIPTYVMSCFQLPSNICDNIRKPIANFWWGVAEGKKNYIGDHGNGCLLRNNWEVWDLKK
jgi:hypothetical protein